MVIGPLLLVVAPPVRRKTEPVSAIPPEPLVVSCPLKVDATLPATCVIVAAEIAVAVKVPTLVMLRSQEE